MPKSFESQCFLFYFAEHINTLILYFYDEFEVGSGAKGEQAINVTVVE